MLIFCSTIFSFSPLDYKTFTSEEYIYFVKPDGIIGYTKKSREFRMVVLNDALSGDVILDVAEKDGLLWLLTPEGVYSFEMNTGTIEKTPFIRENTCSGKIAVDIDYVWLSCSDTLLQYDKLSREWLQYRMPVSQKKAGNIAGVYSTGDEVLIAAGAVMNVFYILDEKWKHYPLTSGSLSEKSRYIYGTRDLFFVENNTIYRYLIESRSWEQIAAQKTIQDIKADEEHLYYLTNESAFSYNLSSSISRRFDIQPMGAAQSVGKVSDSLFLISTPEKMVFYDPVQRASSYRPYPQRFADVDVSYSYPLGNDLILFVNNNVCLYEQGTQLWEIHNLRRIKGTAKRLTLDEEGLALKYKRGYSSTLKGIAEQEITLRSGGYEVDTVKFSYQNQIVDGVPTPVKIPEEIDSTRLFLLGRPAPDINLTLHNSFPEGRYLDMEFDNSSANRPVRKNIKYRGGHKDVLQDGVVGQNTYKVPASRTMPEANYEGVYSVWESPQKLKSRDRKIVRVSSGAGYVTTKTVNKVLAYQPQGIYNLSEKADSLNGNTGATRILPGSVSIWIDGERIDSSYYTLFYTTGMMKFNRRDILEPKSVIVVSYKAEAVPNEGIDKLELVPQNHFKKMGYGDVLISYTDWLSTRVGFTGLSTDSVGNGLLYASVPVELRKKGLFLQINPELTVDVATGYSAGSVNLSSRLGQKTSASFNGFMAGKNFQTTDMLSRGYGEILKDFDYALSYDIVKDLTVGVKQRNSYATEGEEMYLESFADFHFHTLPYLNVSLSRNTMDAFVQTDLQSVATDSSSADSGLGELYTLENTIDTLDRNKDRLKIKLYETSSPYLEKFLHIHKLSYELSHAEFLSNDKVIGKSGQGRMFYGLTSISPIQPVTFNIVNAYRTNPPGSLNKRNLFSSWQVQTIDAPKGVDIEGEYRLDFTRPASRDSSYVLIDRTIHLITKPGSWISWLDWMSPRFLLSQNVFCDFSHAWPGSNNMFFGETDADSSELTRGIGIHLFPTEDLLFRNNNTWKTGNGKEHFNTFNDLKIWFLSKRALWQTRFEYNTDYDREYHYSAYSRFDNIWFPWLTTKQGLRNVFDEDAFKQEIKFGPEFSASLSVFDFFIVKKLINNHDLFVGWKSVDAEFTDEYTEISYNTSLNVFIKPNIMISTSNGFVLTAWAGGSHWQLEDYNGKFTLQAFF
ncbi:MAG: hypothetical protein HQK83_05665 [Fibrobacteria bacterium]|nr:hypothetical protein [Fibrobacteria bacterium]